MPVWMGEEKLAPTGIRSPDRPARNDSLYRLSYPGSLRKKYSTCKFTVKGRALHFGISVTLITSRLALYRTCLFFNLYCGHYPGDKAVGV